jgi:hypothetical protein
MRRAISTAVAKNPRGLAQRHLLSLDQTDQLSGDTLQSQRTAHLESACQIRIGDTVLCDAIGSEIPCLSASS